MFRLSFVDHKIQTVLSASSAWFHAFESPGVVQLEIPGDFTSS